MQQLARILKLCAENGVNFQTLHISRKKSGKQEYIKLSDLPISEDILQEIIDKEKVDKNYAVGNKIANLRTIYNNLDKFWVNLDYKHKKMLEDIPGMLPLNKVAKMKRNIRLFQLLDEAGIDFDNLSLSKGEGNKRANITISDLPISKKASQKIMQETNLDGSYILSTKIREIRKEYKYGNTGLMLDDEDRKAIESIPRIS